MRKSTLLILLLCVSLFFIACGREEEEDLWAAKPSIMVDGVLYGDTGYRGEYRTDTRPDRGGHVDGQITSTVEGHEYPTQNDQSNFGEGYYYRFGEDGTIEVFMEEASVWKNFKAYEE